MSETKLLLGDDHTVVRTGPRALFDRQPDMTVVAEADTVAGGRGAVGRERPDVVVLDLTLPGGGSLEFIRELQTRESSS